jgi:hypothetical protein
MASGGPGSPGSCRIGSWPPSRSTVESLSVKLDQYWDLSVKGCVTFLSGDTAQSFTSTAGLELQYQVPYGKSWSAWKNLAAIPSNEKTSHCGVGGTWFTDTLYGKAPENYAHYRVIYKGTKGATSYASSASPAVLTWRYADRITNYKGFREDRKRQACAHLHWGAAVLRQREVE